jgi:tetratricopeptide (TPR) repeat protein
MNKYEDAIHNLNQAIVLEPNSNGDYYFLKANSLIEIQNKTTDNERVLKEAIECYEKAVKIFNLKN